MNQTDNEERNQTFHNCMIIIKIILLIFSIIILISKILLIFLKSNYTGLLDISYYETLKILEKISSVPMLIFSGTYIGLYIGYIKTNLKIGNIDDNQEQLKLPIEKKYKYLFIRKVLFYISILVTFVGVVIIFKWIIHGLNGIDMGFSAGGSSGTIANGIGGMFLGMLIGLFMACSNPVIICGFIYMIIYIRTKNKNQKNQIE